MFIRPSFIGGLVLGGLVLAAQAQATVLVSYPDFSTMAGLTLTGDAHTITTADGAALRVVRAAQFQAGAAYSATPVALGTDGTFSTQFQFRFTHPGGLDPADGITFVLAASSKGLGSSGQGLGYAGVPNSVAIEFDTYNNGASDGNSSNHIAIDEDGSLNDAALANVYGVQTCNFSVGYTGIGCMSNGDKWTVNIGYDGRDLSVTAKDGSAAPVTAISNYPINLSSLLGSTDAYVGFTGSTGGGRENEDILNWEFANTSTLSAVPEPAGLALLSAGVAAVGFARRRKR